MMPMRWALVLRHENRVAGREVRLPDQRRQPRFPWKAGRHRPRAALRVGRRPRKHRRSRPGCAEPGWAWTILRWPRKRRTGSTFARKMGIWSGPSRFRRRRPPGSGGW